MYSFWGYIGICYSRGAPMYLKSHFLPHTSESPKLGAPRCIITLVSEGDTSGLRFQCPSRCTQVQIYLYNTSGWANIGHFRCIAKDRHTKIHRDSSIHSNPDVSKSSIHRNYSFIPDPDVFILISRECTCFPLQNTPAQAGINPAGYIGICYSKGIPMYYRLPYQPVIHLLVLLS